MASIIKIAGIVLVLIFSFATGYILGISAIVEATSGYYCNNDLSICLEMQGNLPEPYEDAILNFQGLESYLVDENNDTFMQFSVSGLPPGTTPQKLVSYLDNIEKNLQRNKAQTAVVPLIYTQTQPAPLCLRDSDGSLNGLYSVDGALELVTDDPKCFGICGLGDPCQPLSPGGGNAKY